MYRYIKANRTDDYINEYYDDLYGDDIVEEEIIEEIPDYDIYYDEPTPDEEQQLRDFYNARIKDKSTYGLDTYEVCKLGDKLWRTLETKERYTYLYDFMKSPEFVDAAIKEFNVSPEQLVSVVDYAEAQDIYSDWYKDLYGFRPRG